MSDDDPALQCRMLLSGDAVTAKLFIRQAFFGINTHRPLCEFVVKLESFPIV